MKVYILTVTKETCDEPACVSTCVYGKGEDAIKAYNKAFDEAKVEAKSYATVGEDDEIATDTPYRWWSVYDTSDSYDRITVELDVKEIM